MNDTPASDGKSSAGRRRRGFTRAGGLIGSQMATVSARRGFAQARLAALWPEIAGADIAEVAQPVKLIPGRGASEGSLTIAVPRARGPEVQMLLPVLRERINAALGPGTVGRISLTEAGARTGSRPAPRPAAAERHQPTADAGALKAELSTIGDDGLRSALETLARNVLSRRHAEETSGT